MSHDDGVVEEEAAALDSSEADTSSIGPTSRAPMARAERRNPIGVVAHPAGLRGFHPGWFGAVMGTAIVGVAASLNPGHITSMATTTRTLSQVMTVIAAGLGVILLVLYASRFARHGDAALADLRGPAVGALYGTLPGALLVLAAAASAVGPTWFSASTVRDLVAVLDWIGIPLAFVVSLVFAHTLFSHVGLTPEAVNGSWFIPPVVNIVVPLALVPLVPGSSPGTARTLLFLSYGFWGMGFVLYLIIVAMLYQRLVLHPLPHAGLAPSLWIGLGPIGVGALALLKMAAVGGSVFGAQGATVALASKLVATSLWGFGAWWLLAAAALLVHYLRAGSLPYGVGWWGFTFPLGAYTVATLALAQAWNLSSLQWVGAALFVVLSLFWIVVVARTLKALGTGEFTHGPLPASTNQVPNK
jgi:C4-dicarboxylate transporter/malic acid transport protein